MHQFKEEQSVPELFSELFQDLRTLIQQEVRLARIEMTETASNMGKAVGFMAAGGFIAYAGFLVFLAGIVLVLALAIPTWLSALIVGVVVIGVGYALIATGRGVLKSTSMAPRETIETIQEHRDWIQEEARGNGKSGGNGRTH